MVRAQFTIRLDGASLPASAAQWVADTDAARDAARTIVQGLMRQHGGDPRLLGATMVITDADGATLLELPFLDVLYMPVEPVCDADRRPRVPRKRAPTRLGAALGPMRRLAGALGARIQPRPGH
ncbi:MULTISPECIES: DUF6894 family protein [Methylobacterium]|jgi:hypothetical protein|uniref:Catalase n=1 Tax=Methylobacterium longum TaxID=767694 RepID=A0ABT8AJY0_9HYPH|nr:MULTISPECIES: catalase [Methylobacterium]MCJ2101472.1 catalase [Methylobacterium sp. E-046]MDN3569699.1 catalase [Methylobacterium longum]GJE11734.1 hypothetical protein FOHLNKBM_2778 [Methylobacterium longum]